MMRFLAVIAALLLAVSCTPPKEHMRVRYVNDNPDLQKDVKNAILRGDVIIGMTKDQVYASWATPIIRGERKENGTTYEYWTFPDKKQSPFVNLYFLGDFVVKIVKLDRQPDID
jgi:hypothetical protein